MMKLPGTAYIAAIVAISAWVQATFDAFWVTGLVVVLGAIVKLIEVYMVPATAPTVNERMAAPPSKASRFWLGG